MRLLRDGRRLRSHAELHPEVRSGPDLPRGRGRPKGPSRSTDRLIQLLQDDPNATFQSLASRLGITRERVRQIAHKYLGQVAGDRRPHREPTRPKGPPIFGPRTFVRRVNEWLRLIGSWYCSNCRMAVDEGEKSQSYGLRCKECNRRQSKAAYYRMKHAKVEKEEQ